MSDEAVRVLERRWLQTGAFEDELAWRQAGSRAGPPRPHSHVQLDARAGTARFKVAYVGPNDRRRCWATRALELLSAALAPGALRVIPLDGDRVLFCDVALPRFDLGPFRTLVSVHCAWGSTYYRATRRLVLLKAAGVVFVPSVLEGSLDETFESAEHLVEDLARHGVGPSDVPLALQWLPGAAGSGEIGDDDVDFELPFVGTFVTSDAGGNGIEDALFAVVSRARAAFLAHPSAPELLLRPLGPPEWSVALDGEPVATLHDPALADTFWTRFRIWLATENPAVDAALRDPAVWASPRVVVSAYDDPSRRQAGVLCAHGALDRGEVVLRGLPQPPGALARLRRWWRES